MASRSAMSLALARHGVEGHPVALAQFLHADRHLGLAQPRALDDVARSHGMAFGQRRHEGRLDPLGTELLQGVRQLCPLGELQHNDLDPCGLPALFEGDTQHLSVPPEGSHPG